MADSLRRASVASLLSSATTLLVGIATNIALARALGPSAKGTFGVFLNTQGLLLVPGFALQTSITWYIANRRPQWGALRRLISVIVAVQTLASIGLLFALIQIPSLHTFFFAGLDRSYLLPLFVILLSVLWSLYVSALLPGLQRYAVYSLWVTITSVVSSVALLVLIAVVWLLGERLTIGEVVGATALTTLLAALAWTVATKHASTLGRETPADADMAAAIGHFAMPVFLRNVVEWMNYRVDVYFVNAFVGAREVGLYTVATGLAQQLWIIPFAVAEPLFSRIAAEGETKSSREITQYAFRLTLLTSIGIGACMALVTPVLLPLVYGNRFAGATTMMLLLLPGVTAIGPSRTLSSYLSGSSHPGEPLRAELVGLTITISLDLLLIPHYGGRGAALASSAAYIMYTGILCWRFVALSGSTWRGLWLWRRADSQRLGATVSSVATAIRVRL